MSTARPHAISLQIARETRERFVSATVAAIEPTEQAIRDRLTSAANAMGSARDMQNWRDDFLAFQGQGARWVTASQVAWRKTLGVAVAGGNSNSLRLELMGDDVVETTILSSRLAQAIQGKANFEINDLRLRVQYLEDGVELDSKDVLRPEALAKVLVEQWLAVGLTRVLWIRVQDVIERQIVEAAAEAYKAANTYLIEKGVMPEIDLKSFVKRTGGSSSGAAPLGGGGAGGAGFQHGQVATGTQHFAPGVGQGGMQGRGPGGSTMPAGNVMGATGGTPLLMARQRAQGVLMNLKRFVTARIGGDFSQQRGSGGHGAMAGGGVMVPQAFAEAIADADAAW